MFNNTCCFVFSIDVDVNQKQVNSRNSLLGAFLIQFVYKESIS